MESPLRHPTEPGFRLIETLGYDPAQGLRRRDLHLSRMARSAAALGIAFDHDRALLALEGARGEAPLRCRLTLDAQGAFDLTTAKLAASPALWRVAIAPQRVASGDPWLQHKTTRRALYDRARADLPEGIDEWLFLNERDELCEGTITSLFVTLRDGATVTPPLASGLLPGILRQETLARGAAAERVLTLSDLDGASELCMGNSLRGLIRSELVVRPA